MDTELGGFVVALIIGGMLLGFAGYHEGFQDGMVQLASGQWVCNLEPTDNKTTEWVCLKRGVSNVRKRN